MEASFGENIPHLNPHHQFASVNPYQGSPTAGGVPFNQQHSMNNNLFIKPSSLLMLDSIDGSDSTSPSSFFSSPHFADDFDFFNPAPTDTSIGGGGGNVNSVTNNTTPPTGNEMNGVPAVSHQLATNNAMQHEQQQQQQMTGYSSQSDLILSHQQQHQFHQQPQQTQMQQSYSNGYDMNGYNDQYYDQQQQYQSTADFYPQNQMQNVHPHPSHHLQSQQQQQQQQQYYQNQSPQMSHPHQHLNHQPQQQHEIMLMNNQQGSPAGRSASTPSSTASLSSLSSSSSSSSSSSGSVLESFYEQLNPNNGASASINNTMIKNSEQQQQAPRVTAAHPIANPAVSACKKNHPNHQNRQALLKSHHVHVHPHHPHSAHQHQQQQSNSSSPAGAGSGGTVNKREKKVGKKRRDPNEPQKPVSAYALFFRDTQATIKGNQPNASFGEVSKIVASMWDGLDPDSKAHYKKRTEQAKKEYLKALAAYRASLISGSQQSSPSIATSSSSSNMVSGMISGNSPPNHHNPSLRTCPSIANNGNGWHGNGNGGFVGEGMHQQQRQPPAHPSPLQKRSPLLTSALQAHANADCINTTHETHASSLSV